MRDYLKRRGVCIRKAKSWTLRSKLMGVGDLKINSWYGGYNENSLFYTVGVKNTSSNDMDIEIKFKAFFGGEEIVEYKDRKTCFIVDSVDRDLNTRIFVDKWVKELGMKKYRGAWRDTSAYKVGKGFRLKLKKTDSVTMGNSDPYVSPSGLRHSKFCICLKCCGSAFAD